MPYIASSDRKLTFKVCNRDKQYSSKFNNIN